VTDFCGTIVIPKNDRAPPPKDAIDTVVAPAFCSFNSGDVLDR